MAGVVVVRPGGWGVGSAVGRLGTRAGLFLGANDNLAKVGRWVHDGGACGGEGSGGSRGLVEPSQGVHLVARVSMAGVVVVRLAGGESGALWVSRVLAHGCRGDSKNVPLTALRRCGRFIGGY